jgi:lipopolysaccharide transport system permease protein
MNGTIPMEPRVPAADSAAELPVVRITPARRLVPIRFRELWQYRELLYFLVWRDVKVRYKQTFLGAAWAVLQPLVAMAIFTVIFGRFASDRFNTGGVPYHVFALAGLVPWMFFATGLATATTSLVSFPSLVKKVYFPRLLLPLARIMASGVDLLLSGVLLILMILLAGIRPAITWLWLPAFVLLAFAIAAGVALWASALNVRYRDIQHIVPFMIQILFFSTPVVYPSTLFPPEYQPLLALNPMAGVAEGFRWALFGTGWPPGPALAVSVTVAATLLVSGAYFFRAMEKTFPDVL